VVVRGGDLLGGGVNVAARLEGFAEPGGIAISGATTAPRRQEVGVPLGGQHVFIGHHGLNQSTVHDDRRINACFSPGGIFTNPSSRY
jgi:hypothetical protein